MAGGSSSDEEENNLMAPPREEEEAPDCGQDQVGSAQSDDDDDEEDGVGREEEAEDEEESDDAEGQGRGEVDKAKVLSALIGREDVKKDLSAMSFEEILELQRNVGTKTFNRAAYGAACRPAATARKRLNKNRPAEVSAKKQAPFLRRVVAVKKRTQRDPRFDDLSGEYKPEIFDRTYNFINDIRRQETQVLQKQLKKTKSTDKKDKLSSLLRKMTNQERARQSRESQWAERLQRNKEQREQALRGARPVFLSKSQQKKLQLAASFSALKTSGKLDAFLGKKRKRNAAKDRKKLPWPTQRRCQNAP